MRKVLLSAEMSSGAERSPGVVSPSFEISSDPGVSPSAETFRTSGVSEKSPSDGVSPIDDKSPKAEVSPGQLGGYGFRGVAPDAHSFDGMIRRLSWGETDYCLEETARERFT